MKETMRPATAALIAALLCGWMTATIAAGPALTERDVSAAEAIVLERTRLHTWLEACKKEVPEVADNGLNLHERFDAVFADWERVNFDYVDIAAIIRNDRLTEIETRRGTAAMRAEMDEMVSKITATRAAARMALSEVAESQRQGKCLGIMTFMVQGRLDITKKLVEEARHIESRIELMGW